jgi:adenosine deaminase CECR1
MQTFLETYQAERAKLIREDRALRWDLSTQNRCEAEIQADHIVRSIRAAEALSIWNVEHESVPHVFPGMEFLTGIQLNLFLALIGS